MTIGSVDRVIPYTTTGASLGPFDIPFQFFEIAVYLDGSLVDPALYTITWDDDEAGLTGSITYNVVGDEPSGALSIVGVTTRTQQTDYEQNASFPAASHEKALDRLTMICQELSAALTNAIIGSIGSGTATDVRDALHVYSTDEVDELLDAKQPIVVDSAKFNPAGDGIADDTLKLQHALDAVEAAGGGVLALRPGTYKITAGKSVVSLGVTRHYCLDIASNTKIYGEEGLTTIILAAGQSTDLAPRDVGFFALTDAFKNIAFRGVKFDMNGQNNPISPHRNTTFTGTISGTTLTVSSVTGTIVPGQVVYGVGVEVGTTVLSGAGTTWTVNTAQSVSPVSMRASMYNYYCSGVVNVTGDTAWIDGLTIADCEFWNCPGTNVIVTGQSNNGVAGPLSQNVRIRSNKFRNNGLDTDDHSTIYSWAENVWACDNIFEQDAALSKVDRNWGTFEIHGANTWYLNNTVKNYYRGLFIAPNFTKDTSNLHVAGNSFDVWECGMTAFRNLASYMGVTNVHIHDNDITLNYAVEVASPTTTIRAAFDVVTQYGVSEFYIYNNRVRASGSGYPSAGLNLSCGTGEQTKHVYFENNKVESVVTGVYARVNLGDGALSEIHARGNTFINLGTTKPADTAVGVLFYNGSNISRVSSIGNHYIASDGLSNFDWGEQIVGTIDDVIIDGCTYDGLVNFPSNSPYSVDISSATITRKRGRMLSTGIASPSTGTWSYGDVFWNYLPDLAKNISHWVHNGTTFRAFGHGLGTTAQRPSLTTRDSGYSYFDTDLGQAITWDGTGWNTGATQRIDHLNLGNASDTTLERGGAGVVTVEGNIMYAEHGIDVAIADGGTGASTQVGARTNLGLGTGDSPQFLSIELGAVSDTSLTRVSAGDMNIEGHIVYRDGGTDVAVLDGGTGASSATGARSNLGATAVGDALFIASGAGNARSTLGVTTVGDALFTAASATAARSAIGAVIGTDVEAHAVNLTAFAGLTGAANKLPYFTGAGALALADLSAFARTFLDDPDAVTVRGTISANIDEVALSTIASATTTDLGSVNSQSITISGVTTITSFGSSAATGAVKFVEFSGALTLTHNGTSLIIPGGLNVTTVAGDCLLARHEGSGNWRVLEYTHAGGWTTYTPTVAAQAGTFTSVVATGRYRQIGKTVFLQSVVVITTNGTAAGYISTTLPSGMTSAAVRAIGATWESQATGNTGTVVIQASDTVMRWYTLVNTYPGASGYTLSASVTFEIA